MLQTPADWLMLTLRNAIPYAMPLARVEFSTLSLRLLKIGARVIERATSFRFASACPNTARFRPLVRRLAAAG